eukprot:TRINITY_DN5368_c0_g1_i4.p1 TRINITY_DN5368_c0_g1~~TRINITY_DN5368_c0_g1_i4.p1  ORF type:complete len:198 (+),score=54.74 TRINITY_DN5368_c0_g1_i4:185-778(+)
MIKRKRMRKKKEKANERRSLIRIEIEIFHTMDDKRMNNNDKKEKNEEKEIEYFSFWNRLPRDIINVIFSLLNRQDRNNARSVCSEWKKSRPFEFANFAKKGNTNDLIIMQSLPFLLHLTSISLSGLLFISNQSIKCISQHPSSTQLLSLNLSYCKSLNRNRNHSLSPSLSIISLSLFILLFYLSLLLLLSTCHIKWN